MFWLSIVVQNTIHKLSGLKHCFILLPVLSEIGEGLICIVYFCLNHYQLEQLRSRRFTSKMAYAHGWQVDLGPVGTSYRVVGCWGNGRSQFSSIWLLHWAGWASSWYGGCFKKECSKGGSRSYQFLKAQSKKTVHLPSYSIGQNHLSPSGWRCRSHLPMSGLPKNFLPSLFHCVVCDKKCLKTTNWDKQNVWQQLNPQTRAQLSYIRNSWASEVGLLSPVHLLKAVHQTWAQVYSLNDFLLQRHNQNNMRYNVGENRV